MRLTTPLLMLLLLSQACERTEILEVPAKGTLQGYVWEGNNPVDRLEGVEVTIEGTDPQVTATTDDNGAFQVNDLSTGTYHLIFQKPGFGMNKILGYTFIAGNQPSVVEEGLHPLPLTSIKDLSVTVTKKVNYTILSGVISVDLPADFEPLYFRYYLSNSSDVSPSNYLFTDAIGVYPKAEVNINFTIDTEMFPPGSELYIVIYPCTEPYSWYLNLETGKKLYTSISPQGSNVLSATIPL